MRMRMRINIRIKMGSTSRKGISASEERRSRVDLDQVAAGGGKIAGIGRNGCSAD